MVRQSSIPGDIGHQSLGTVVIDPWGHWPTLTRAMFVFRTWLCLGRGGCERKCWKSIPCQETSRSLLDTSPREKHGAFPQALTLRFQGGKPMELQANSHGCMTPPSPGSGVSHLLLELLCPTFSTLRLLFPAGSEPS